MGCGKLRRSHGPGRVDYAVEITILILRRQGVVGKTQTTLDLDLILPSMGERAFVQVKSRTDSKELADYVSRIDAADEFNRMFYVYHTGHAATEDQRVVGGDFGAGG